MNTMNRVVAIGLIAVASAAGAQQQTLPPARPLGPVIAMSDEPMSSVAQVRALPGGRVIVHDLTGRRVLMFDSTFKHATVIADSTSATGNAYGSRLGGLIAYRGDSTLFVDPQSISMLVIDPTGKIVRTMAAPLPNEVQALIGGQNGTPGFDGQGRLVYRAQFRPTPAMMRGLEQGKFQMPQLPESSYVVRVDLKSRKVDTAATFRIPKIIMNVTSDDNGRVMVTPTVNPIPWTDDWALLSDGTLAVVRGQDYRVDFVALDGKVTPGPKMQFEWQRLSDEEKGRIIDSTKTAMEKLRDAQLAQMTAANPEAAKADSASKAGGRQRVQASDGGNMTVTIGGGGRGRDPGVAGPIGFTMPPLQFVALSEMADYRPAFRQGASRGDAEGNLWIRTSRLVNGATEYDVIDNKGELKDRVLVPQGRVIAGFGPGVVYMGVLDGMTTRLEKARVR